MNEVIILNSNDLELARRAKKDRRAAEELLLQVRPRVKRAIRILVGSDRDAEDLMSQTLLQVLESIGKYRGTGTLEAWAGRIAFHVVTKYMKRRWMTEKVMVLETNDIGVAQSNPEREISNQRIRDRLEEVLGKLPEERRVTLVLRLVFGHSLNEISTLTGVPVNTVRGRLRTGLKEVRKSVSSKNADIVPINRKKGLR